MRLLINKEKIQEAKEKLGDNAAQLIADVLEVQNYDQKNMKGLCPFHQEDTPSFVWNSKAYSFHCFGCGVNVDLISAHMSKGKTYLEAVEKLFEAANVRYSFGEKHIRTRRDYRYPTQIECADKPRVYEYLGIRKISKETVDYLDIREDDQGNIVWNYYDTNDVLCMVKYRPSHKISKDQNGKKENKAWCQPGADTMPLLFNMNRVNPDMPLLITEGEPDTAAAVEAGYLNAVSVPFGANNFAWIEENWDWLMQFSTVIICADNDDPGRKLRQEVINRLGAYKCRIAIIPEYKEREGKAPRKIKDLNDVLYWMGKDAVMDVILNAQECPINNLIDLSDVKIRRMEDVDGIQIGLKPLDNHLMRLFNGTLTILSGLPGSGKSSLLSQIICRTADEGKCVAVYSKELENPMQKTWTHSIWAGPWHAKEYRSKEGASYYRFSDDVLTEIDNYYRGKVFLYRDEASGDETEILKTLEDSVRIKGCKLVVLDNLMCIDFSSDKEDDLKQQTSFIRKLVAFSIKFSVAVILVAHPRKLPAGQGIGKFDVAGTMNIVNLCSRMLSLKRVSEKEKQENPDSDKGKYDVIISVVKDRVLGRESIDVGVYYDKRSRRFYTNEEELNYQYQWDKGRHERIPFCHPDPTDEVLGKVEKKE